MPVPNRREFLKSSAATGAGLLGGPALASGRKSPNDRIRMAFVGIRGRGGGLMRGFQKLAEEKNLEIVALCDVDESVLRERAAELEKLSGKRAPTFGDMRRLFDDKSLDAVGFGTPNHWHALGTIWACQAGKDVYVEKPGSHNIFEGRKVMEAARKYGRLVQHGTQNRSSPNIVEAIGKLKEGVIGRVYMARGVAYKTRGAMGRITEDPVPPGLSWDLWLGPAPKVPYSRKRNLRPAGNSWHVLWDYGNGEIGNQGVHELDIIRWGLGLDTHPDKVASVGGTYIYDDDQQCPQAQTVFYEWKDRNVMVTFETRSGFTNPEAGMGTLYRFLNPNSTAVVGVIFIGTEGYMILPDYSSYHTFLGPDREPGPSKVHGSNVELPHFANFIDVVRTRKEADLAAGPRELHRSSALAHLANISVRTGRMLEFDPGKERFAGSDEANALLTRDYRAPYVVSDEV